MAATTTRRRRPSLATLERWASEGLCPAVDGCPDVELDGRCEHGRPSWVLALGFI